MIKNREKGEVWCGPIGPAHLLPVVRVVRFWTFTEQLNRVGKNRVTVERDTHTNRVSFPENKNDLFPRSK